MCFPAVLFSCCPCLLCLPACYAVLDVCCACCALLAPVFALMPAGLLLLARSCFMVLALACACLLCLLCDADQLACCARLSAFAFLSACLACVCNYALPVCLLRVCMYLCIYTSMYLGISADPFSVERVGDATPPSST